MKKKKRVGGGGGGGGGEGRYLHSEVPTYSSSTPKRADMQMRQRLRWKQHAFQVQPHYYFVIGLLISVELTSPKKMNESQRELVKISLNR